MLGQQWIYSPIYFLFLVNVSDSCWLSKHSSTAALRAVPLNISFLATQKPHCRAWDSLCSIWGVALNFPGDLWQIVYLPHLQGEGNHSSLLHLHQSVPHVLFLLLGNIWRRLSHQPATTMSNDENSLFRHMICKGVFYLNNNFGF